MGFQNAVNNTINAAAIISTANKVEKQKETEQYESDLKTVAKTSDEIRLANKKLNAAQKNAAPINKALANYSTDDQGNVFTKSGKKASQQSLNKKTRLEHDLEAYTAAMDNLQQVIAAKNKIREMANSRITAFEGGKR